MFPHDSGVPDTVVEEVWEGGGVSERDRVLELGTSGQSSCVPCLLPPGDIMRSREIPSDSTGEDPEEQIVGAARCGAWSCKAAT